mgnify:CR=1 FL=1
MAGAGVVLLKPLQFQIVQLAWAVQLFWSLCEVRRPLLAWADQADPEAAGVAPVDAAASTATSAAVAATHAPFLPPRHDSSLRYSSPNAPLPPA